MSCVVVAAVFNAVMQMGSVSGLALELDNSFAQSLASEFPGTAHNSRLLREAYEIPFLIQNPREILFVVVFLYRLAYFVFCSTYCGAAAVDAQRHGSCARHVTI